MLLAQITNPALLKVLNWVDPWLPAVQAAAMILSAVAGLIALVVVVAWALQVPGRVLLMWLSIPVLWILIVLTLLSERQPRRSRR